MADIKNHSTLTTSLVSYWDLEEASGTRYDLHGSNNLTDNNTVTQAAGKTYGNGADFESTNTESLSIADGSQTGLDLSNNFSFSYWIKFESYTDGIAIGKSNTGQEAFYIQHDTGGSNNAQRFSDSAETTVDITYTFSLATWYHVVWTFASGTVELFVNGASQGTASGLAGTITNRTSAFSLGKVEKYSNALDGVMDEVGVWSKVLTSGEITDLYNSGNGLPYYDPTDVKNDSTLSTSLVSYWELEETSGTRVDSHGSNDLTASGVSYAAGKNGNAADFEASSNEYLSITDGSQTGLDITGNFSLSLWIKPESLSGTSSPAIISKVTSGTGYAFTLDWSSTPAWKPTWVREDSSTPLQGTSVPSVGNWTHYVWTYDGTDLRLYIDGSLNAGPTAYTIHSDSGADFNIGRNVLYTTRLFDGLIDELAIWSKGLTVAEVRALYGYGTPPEYEVVSGGSVNTSHRRGRLTLMGVG